MRTVVNALLALILAPFWILMFPLTAIIGGGIYAASRVASCDVTN